MTSQHDMTPEEEDLIRRCCSWLDDETIDLCRITASEAADQITEPEIAEELLAETLIGIIVRNRRTTRAAEQRK
ncbi:MAG: hypothetical protein ABSB35_33155 [Bryobacteraceae bacterium]|jgi:hypothetical protein